MTSAQRNKRWLVWAVKAMLTIAVVYFAGRQLAHGWDEVVAYPWKLDFFWVSFSLCLHLLAFVLFALAWCYVVEGFGYRVELPHAFKLAYVANLGRYLPGRIWTVFGMAYLARRVGLPETVSIASWIIAVIFSLPTAFLLSATVVVIHPEMVSTTAGLLSPTVLYVVGALSVVASVALFFMPDKTLYVANLVLRLARRPTIQYRATVGIALRVYVAYLVSWLVFGIAFWCLLKGVLGDSSVPLSAAVGAYVFAYQIGFVAIFSPGGIGVRELALSAFLVSYVGPIAAGISVAARLWNLVAEIIAAVVALGIKLPGVDTQTDVVKANQPSVGQKGDVA